MNLLAHYWATISADENARIEAALLEHLDEDEAMTALQVMREHTAPASNYRGAVEALEWLADRYAATLAGKSVRDADEALERARLIVNAARGQ